MLMIPFLVNSIPLRAFRVGITQSNMSIPKAIFSKILMGVPTPIKYRGFSFGNIADTTSVMAYISSAGSPTDRPPIAFPSRSNEAITSADFSRKSLRSEERRVGKEWRSRGSAEHGEKMERAAGDAGRTRTMLVAESQPASDE